MLHGDISNQTAPMLYVDLDELVTLQEVPPRSLWGRILPFRKKEYRYDTAKLAFILKVVHRTDMNVVFVSKDKHFANYMMNRQNFFKVFGSIRLSVRVTYMTPEILESVLSTRCGYLVSDSYSPIDAPYIYTYDEIRKLIF